MELRTLFWPAGARDPVGVSAPRTQAPGVVLIHGLGDTADVWRPVMRHLQLPYATMAVDLPGHGRSPCLQREGSVIEEMITCLTDILLKTGVYRPVLVGHSLGARLCASLALGPNICPAGTILIDMGVRQNDTVEGAILEHLDRITAGAVTLEQLIESYCDQIPLSDPAAVDIVVRAMAVLSEDRWCIPLDRRVRELVMLRKDEDIWNIVARLEGPVEIIRGAFSAVLTREAAEKMITLVRFRAATVRVIGMASHAILLQQPADLAKTLDVCIRDMMTWA